ENIVWFFLESIGVTRVSVGETNQTAPT
ncbi:hypothetical protein ACUXFE_001509, partial [Kocuria palustris]